MSMGPTSASVVVAEIIPIKPAQQQEIEDLARTFQQLGEQRNLYRRFYAAGCLR